jgi:hypothetical protein
MIGSAVFDGVFFQNMHARKRSYKILSEKEFTRAEYCLTIWVQNKRREARGTEEERISVQQSA